MVKYVLRVIDISFSVNTAHNGHVNGMCFTPDGLHLLTFGTDENLHLWETFTGKNTMVNFGRISNESRKCIKFSACTNSKPELVFVPGDSNIEIFDIYTGLNIATLRGHYNQVNCCYFHPSYQFLISGGNDRNILIWEPITGTVQAYEDHLRGENKDTSASVSNFLTRTGATVDTWSSDED